MTLNDPSPPQIPLNEIPLIDCVVLSHAHVDHSGNIPWLYRHGCRAPLIATEPTLAIARLLMEDHLKLQRLEGVPPNYEYGDIEKALSHARIVAFRQTIQLGRNISMFFLPAGHMLGASMVRWNDHGERILYSADISSVDTRILRGARIPQDLDHIIIETTFGDRLHKPRKDAEDNLLGKTKLTLKKGGTVIIPCFALRGPDVLEVLQRSTVLSRMLGPGKDFPLYVDGLILAMSDIHEHYLAAGGDHHFNPDLLAANRVPWSYTPVEDRRALCANREPKAVITPSGMCHGLAEMYLSHFMEDARNALILTGYQAEGTLGWQLRRGERTIIVDGQQRTVALSVHNTPFSGHADRAQIIDQLRSSRLKNLILVHGELHAMDAFAEEAGRVLQPENLVKLSPYREMRLY